MNQLLITKYLKTRGLSNVKQIFEDFWVALLFESSLDK